MADTKNYFDVERGLGIEGLVNIIPVSGAPGASGDSATCPAGSLALDYSSTPKALYVKIATGSGTDKWYKVATVNDIGQISWREPVIAMDDASVTIPSGLGATDTRDDVTINDGDRVLFSAISGGDGPNVYIFHEESSGGAGDGYYEEAPNDETSGDRVYVIDGTDHAGEEWSYNAAGAWVLVRRPGDVNELGFIRQFIGKSAAGDLSASEPDYTSTNHVSDLDDLVTAISALDAQLGAELVGGNIVSPGDDIATAIEALDDWAGLISVSGSLSSVSGAQALDSLNPALIAWAEWEVRCQDGGNIRSWVVSATHDGTASSGASNTDREVHSRLLIGSLAASIVSVSLSGTYPTQTLTLNVTSTPSVDWQFTRRVVPF